MTSSPVDRNRNIPAKRNIDGKEQIETKIKTLRNQFLIALMLSNLEFEIFTLIRMVIIYNTDSSPIWMTLKYDVGGFRTTFSYTRYTC